MGRPALNKTLAFLPAVLSGILLVLSFPIFDFYFLAWVAFVPLLVSLWQKKPGEAFYSGLVFGIIYFFGTLYWIYHSVYHFGGVSLASSILIIFFLCSYLSLYPAVFCFLVSLGIRKTTLPALAIAPIVWVSLEFARAYALTGFPWSSVGYSQYKFLSAIQVSDITGIYGISFLVLAFNGALADTFLLKKRLNSIPLFPLFSTVAGFIVLGCLLAFTAGYGVWRLSQYREGRPVAVSVIQGNIEQDKKWDPSFQQEVLDTYAALSAQALSAGPSLVVWPETAVPFFFGHDTLHTENLIGAQKKTGTHLLFGSVLLRKQTPARNELTNSAVLLDQEGKKIYSYDKIHLVPFGEYVPLKSILFFVDKLVVGIGDYIPGKQYVRAETEFGSFGTFICYEIIFPGLVRKFYARGGDFIVTITNDAWFGQTAGPYQHFSMAVFRAIENRKPVIRAANTGVSGFIDSNGRILSRSSLFQRQVLTGVIKRDNSLTLYSRYGDLFSYFCIMATVVFSIDLLFSRR
jgi:apolipoprotein N-acyltransferase